MYKRVFSLMLVAALLLVWADGISVGAATTHYTVWQDADALHAAENWVVDSGTGGVTVTSRKSYSGNGYAWSRGASGGASTLVLSVTATGGSGEDGLVLWVDTTEQPEATAIYSIKLYTKSFIGTNVFRIKAGGSATLLCDGAAQALTCAANELYLPAGRTGWLVLPFSSFQRESGLSSSVASGGVQSVRLSTETAYNSILYMDDIGFATNVSAFTTAVSGGTLAAKRPSACDTGGHKWQALCTEAATCAVCGASRAAGSHKYAGNVCTVCGYGRYTSHLGGGYYGATADNAYFRTAFNSNSKVPTAVENENSSAVRVDNSPAGYGSAVHWLRTDHTSPSGITLSAEKGLSGDAGVAVWLDMQNGGVGEAGLRLMLRDFAGTTERCWRLKQDAVFYTVEDGVVKEKRIPTAQYTRLPASFCGWLIIPYTSFEWQWGAPSGQTGEQQALDPTQVQRVNLYYDRPATFTDGVLVDEFGYYTDLDGFLRTVSHRREIVVNRLDDAAPDGVAADGSVKLSYVAVAGRENKVLQVTAEDGDLRLCLAIRAEDADCLRERAELDGFAGLGFRVSAPQGAVLRPRLEQQDGTVCGVSARYWLVYPETGVTYSRLTDEDGGVCLPVGFAGWVVLEAAAPYDMTALEALRLTFTQAATVQIDTLYAATSAAGLITHGLGCPMDSDLLTVTDPGRAAVTTLSDGQRLISLYGRLSSAEFRRAVTVRGGYRCMYVDETGRYLYGTLADMTAVTAVEVYLSSTLQETYLLTAATGSSACAALGHSWTGGSCTAAGVCAVCGASQPLQQVGHRWVDATCATPKTCSVCCLTEGTALTHDWLPANCGKAAACAHCGITEGAPAGGAHSWQGGYCAVCGKPLVAVVQDFEKGTGVSYSTADGYRWVDSANGFGNKSLLLQSSTETWVHINFNQFGQSSQTALAFRYDLTALSKTGADSLFYVYPRDGGGNRITLSNKNTYYVVTGGKVTARTSGEHMGVLLPNGTAGWVVLPIPGNSTWQNNSVHDTYYGTMKWLYGIDIRLPYRTTPNILVDHFVYVEDIDEFTALAAAGDENVTGNTLYHTPQAGDLDGDGAVTVADAVYLLYHTLLPTRYPLTQDGDYTADSRVDGEDAIYLLYHALLPDAYPLR